MSLNVAVYASALEKANRAVTKTSTRIERVEAENRRLRHELAQLRQQAGRGGRLWILRRAKEDALTLALWGLAGDNVSRRAAVARGFSQRRWQWAQALLDFSGAYWRERGLWGVDDLADATWMLDQAVAWFQQNDPTLRELVARLPKGALVPSSVPKGTNKAEPSRVAGRREDSLQQVTEGRRRA